MRKYQLDFDKRKIAYMWLIFAATCGIIGKTGMRAAATENHLLYIPILTMIVLANASLFMVMRSGMALGSAYALWSATGIFASTVVAKILYDEEINIIMIIGLIIITISVFVIERGNKLLSLRSEEV